MESLVKPGEWLRERVARGQPPGTVEPALLRRLGNWNVVSDVWVVHTRSASQDAETFAVFCEGLDGLVYVTGFSVPELLRSTSPKIPVDARK